MKGRKKEPEAKEMKALLVFDVLKGKREPASLQMRTNGTRLQTYGRALYQTSHQSRWRLLTFGHGTRLGHEATWRRPTAAVVMDAPPASFNARARTSATMSGIWSRLFDL